MREILPQRRNVLTKTYLKKVWTNIGTYRSNVPTYAGTNKELLREGCVREKKNGLALRI